MTFALCIIGAFIGGIVVSALYYEKALAAVKTELAKVKAEADATISHAHSVIDAFAQSVVREYQAAKQAVVDAEKKI